MKKEQFLGIIRELATLIGALAFAGFEGWSSIVGLVVAIAAIGYAVFKKQGIEILFTSIRKALSLVPGLLVQFGVIEPDKAELWVAMIAPLYSLVWSYVSNGPMPKSNNKLPIIFLALIVVTFLSSCALEFTEDGCVLTNYTKNGNSYSIGPCVGSDTNGDGKADINRIRAKWTNEQNNILRATYWLDSSNPVVIEYLVSGIWIQWDVKSGVSLANMPEPVQDAIEQNPQPIKSYDSN